VIDAAVMSVVALRSFYENSMTAAREKDILLSLHVKATIVKVSDPILFGHAVTVYFKDVFTRSMQIRLR
jgi:isocitrate dehydrogenase